MIISAIRYSLGSGGHETYLRFGKPSGTYRNFCYHHGSSEELETLAQALCFAFTGANHDVFRACSINLIDRDGHSWVIDRTASSTRFFRDRELIKGGLTPGQLILALDLDSSANSDPMSPTDIILPLVLREQRDKLIGEKSSKLILGGSDDEESPLRTYWYSNLGKCRQHLPEISQLSDAEITSFLCGVDPIVREWAEILKERSILKDLNQAKYRVAGDYLENLEAQIELIFQIETVGKPLYEAARSPAQLVEKYKEVDTKLRELCAECEISTIPPVQKSIQWEKVLNTLGRLKIYDFLEKSSELAREKVKGEVEPVLKAYYETVDTFLKNDKQIMAELESCLSILSSHVSPNIPDPSLGQSWMGRVKERLGTLRRPSKVATPPDDSPGKDLEVVPQRDEALERSRMAVDYALGRLGELQSNLFSRKESYHEAVTQIDQRHERIVAEYGRLRYGWNQMARKIGLADEASLKSVLNLIQNYGQIARLWSEREALKEDVESYQDHLQKLEGLVLQWRRLTNSAKDHSLKNPSILLSEVRGILDYAAKKKSQLNKLKKMQIQQAAFEKLDQVFSSRQIMVKQKWARLCQEYQVEELTLQDHRWEQIRPYAAALLHYEEAQGESEGRVEDHKLFNDQTIPQPMTLFYWKALKNLTKARRRLLDLLESSEFSGFGLFLIEDRILVEQLAKIGVPGSSKVKTPKPARKKAVSSPPRQESVLSSRAKKALELLGAEGKSQRQSSN